MIFPFGDGLNVYNCHPLVLYIRLELRGKNHITDDEQYYGLISAYYITLKANDFLMR